MELHVCICIQVGTCMLVIFEELEEHCLSKRASSASYLLISGQRSEGECGEQNLRTKDHDDSRSTRPT